MPIVDSVLADTPTYRYYVYLSHKDKVMRVINGCEVELDVAEDPFEWMYDDDDLVLQVECANAESHNV